MNSRRAGILLIAVTLILATVPTAVSAAASEGSGGPPAYPGARGDENRGGSRGNAGNATDGDHPGTRGNGDEDIREKHRAERQEFFKNQSQERREFMREHATTQRNASNGAAGSNGTGPDAADSTAAGPNATSAPDDGANETSQKDRAAALRAAREAFLAEQRAERAAFLEAQRGEQRAVELTRKAAWDAERPDNLPVPERMGRFGAADGDALGRYVTFNYSLAPATVHDVRVGGQLIFDSLGLGGNGSAAASLAGAAFTLGGAQGSVAVHDNPAAVIRVHPDGGAGFALDLADYLLVEGHGTAWNVSDGDALVARLHFAEATSFDTVNRTFRGHGDVRFVARTMQPHLAASNAHRDAIHDAIDARDVGAEVTVVDAHGESAEETLLYDDLNVSVLEAEEGSVRLLVDGEGDTGKTIVLNVDAALFQGDGIVVRYFDIGANETVEVPIVEASSLADVLEPNDDSTPEYWIVEDADGVQVLVTVPHFSAHEVRVQSVGLDAPPAPTVVAGLLGAVVFLGVATRHMFRRPDE